MHYVLHFGEGSEQQELIDFVMDDDDGEDDDEEEDVDDVKVDDEDLQQWDKVVCCVAVTADVYQASTDGRVPKDARLIVSAKPQLDSRAAV